MLNERSNMRPATSMLSRVLLPSSLAAATAGTPAPDLVVAFLPPGGDLPARLAALAATWPEALLLGCEASIQFADGRLETAGCLQLHTFERPGTRVWMDVVQAAGETELPPEPELARLAARLRAADASFLIADGLRFPIQPFLSALRGPLGRPVPPIAGALASQELPIASLGARVFAGTRIYPAACLAVGFEGVRMEVEIVRGWDPASPVFTVTHAAGNTVYAIDDEPATAWYHRYFTADGVLAPLPESAWRFPLIIDGPDPARHGLYRSMQSFDAERQAVTYWGDVVTGDQVRLGIGNDASLARAAATCQGSAPAQAAVLYSCVGREIVLGAEAHREAAAVHRALGGIPLAGFFSFGEIGPTPRGGLAFYNQTAVLALLREEQ
jgi:hypothetical protein